MTSVIINNSIDECSGHVVDEGDPVHLYFPGTADNYIQITELQASTVYDVTIHYLDGTTANITPSTDAGTNLILGNDMVGFVDKYVARITASSPENIDADFSDESRFVGDPFAGGYFDSQSAHLVFLNRSAGDPKLQVIGLE